MTCDDEQSVFKIKWVGHVAIQGDPCWAAMPPELHLVQIYKNTHQETFELDNLPTVSRGISLCHNGLIGSLDLTRLNDALQWISIHDSSFSGSVCLSPCKSISSFRPEPYGGYQAMRVVPSGIL